MKKFNVALTKFQVDYLRALNVLLEGKNSTLFTPRVSGKTFVIAYYFLDLAFDNIDKEVNIFDHYYEPRYENIFKTIKYIFDDCMDDSFMFDRYGNRRFELLFNLNDKSIKVVYVEED